MICRATPSPRRKWTDCGPSWTTGSRPTRLPAVRWTHLVVSGVGRLPSVTTPVVPISERQLVGESRHSSKEFICSVRPSLNDRFRLLAALQLFEKLSPRSAAIGLPGRPEESHLQPPTDPYVSLSTHTARASHSHTTTGS